MSGRHETTIRSAAINALYGAAVEAGLNPDTNMQMVGCVVAAFLRDYSKAVRWPGDDLVFIADVVEALANE